MTETKYTYKFFFIQGSKKSQLGNKFLELCVSKEPFLSRESVSWRSIFSWPSIETLSIREFSFGTNLNISYVKKGKAS